MSTDELDRELIDFWLKAASELGVRVTVPYEFELDDGSTVQCEAKIHDFASPDGALVLSRATSARILSILRAQSVSPWVSTMWKADFTAAYCKEMLDDWGWFGETSEIPEWYSGAPWS